MSRWCPLSRFGHVALIEHVLYLKRMDVEILYPNLLLHKKDVEGIVRLIVERIAIGDAPFLSRIQNGFISLGLDSAPLNDCSIVEKFVREKFFIPEPCRSWKDIRKQSAKNALIYRYARRSGAEHEYNKELLSLHLMMASKRITNDDILMATNTFEIQNIQKDESNSRSSVE